jgi:hypothetical protein
VAKVFLKEKHFATSLPQKTNLLKKYYGRKNSSPPNFDYFNVFNQTYIITKIHF